MNAVILTGTVASRPRRTETGRGDVSNFFLAVVYDYRDKHGVPRQRQEEFSISAWGAVADIACSLQLGDRAEVLARLEVYEAHGTKLPSIFASRIERIQPAVQTEVEPKGDQ
ncbi:MAG: single-stranded DNA-binding protein [Candidatus Acidiferrales bacterium]